MKISLKCYSKVSKLQVYNIYNQIDEKYLGRDEY